MDEYTDERGEVLKIDFSDDDLKISIEDRGRFTHKKMPSSEDLSVQQFQVYNPDSLQIFSNLDALLTIWQHSRADTRVESGGILVGDVFSDDGIPFVEINGLLEARFAKQERTSITFTSKTWEDIIARLGSGFPGKKMVGWYHSHPGFGVFLSEFDKFVQKSVYPKETDVAFVIDPVSIDYAFFQWKEGGLVRSPGFKVFAAKERSVELDNFVRIIKEERASAGRTTTQRMRVRERDDYDVLLTDTKGELRSVADSVWKGLVELFNPTLFWNREVHSINGNIIVGRNTSRESFVHLIDDVVGSLKNKGLKRIHLEVCREDGLGQELSTSGKLCTVDWPGSASRLPSQEEQSRSATGALITWCGDEFNIHKGSRA